ncbi:hypothetical protein D623_10009610 [Myotis brandtii]|uniref:Uncharacterized protein n=1 Tax=Myotis brandtii TaxID=109478 RepID=S7N1J4_MYOBR|nr:hypothetical protein D623_10009610 [Myotis brandtii]
MSAQSSNKRPSEAVAVTPGNDPEWRLRGGDETNGRNASHSPDQKSPKQLCRKLPHILVIFILFVAQNSENQNRLKPLERVEGGARHGPRDRNL